MFQFRSVFIIISLLLHGVLSVKTPNTLVLFIDDMGYGDLGCQGNNTVHTPNIDNLSHDGVRFTQWISGDSLCTPSRGALLTGRLPVRIGLAHPQMRKRVLFPFSAGGLPLEEHTLAEAFKERGYKTHISGKWHLGVGKEKKYLPINHGFDNHYGMGLTNVNSCGEGDSTKSFLYDFKDIDDTTFLATSLAILLVSSYLFKNVTFIDMKYGLTVIVILILIVRFVILRATYLDPKNCVLFLGDQIVQQPVKLSNLTQRVTEDATRFMVDSVDEDKPFFLYLSYHKMHVALFANDEFVVEEDQQYPSADYLSNLRELDWSVGYIIDRLKELGVYEDTLIWLVSDNGPDPPNGSNEFITTNSAGQEVTKTLRAAKGSIYEGGFRVPGMVVYKRRFPSGIVTDEAVNTMDIFPTSLRIVDDALGVNSGLTYTIDTPHTILDGQDITDLVESLGSENEKSSPHSEMIQYCGDILAAVRIDSQYKAYLLTNSGENLGRNCKGKGVTHHDPPLLYDIKNDVEEKVLLTADNFEDFQTIIDRVQEAIQRHNDTLAEYPNRPSELVGLIDYSIIADLCCNKPLCECDDDPY